VVANQSINVIKPLILINEAAINPNNKISFNNKIKPIFFQRFWLKIRWAFLMALIIDKFSLAIIGKAKLKINKQ
jgi:hypothetical protein